MLLGNILLALAWTALQGELTLANLVIGYVLGYGVLRLLALFQLRHVVERRSRTLAHSARALGRSGGRWGSPVSVAAALLWVPARADGLRREAFCRTAPHGGPRTTPLVRWRRGGRFAAKQPY